MSAPRRHNKIELNFWVMPNAGFATRRILQTYIDEFERVRPDVKIKLTIHPWSLAWNRVMEVVKGRNVKVTPDVLQVGTTWVTTLSYLGALDKIPDGGPDPAEMGTLGDSSPYCMPWFIDIRVLYYRRDIFEQLGLDARLLDDWKGFHRACAEIKKAIAKDPRLSGIRAPVGIPGQKPGVLMHDLAPWVWEAGGDFCSEEAKETNIYQAPFLQGCEFYFDLIDQGFMPIPNSALPHGNFFSGNYAMQFSGAWPVDTFFNPDYTYATPAVVDGFGVAPLPAGPQGRYTFLGGSNLTVPAGSANKDVAWEFVKFMSESSRLLGHARSIGSLPARLGGMENLFLRYPAAKDVFFSSFGYARRLPKLVELGSVEQILYKMGLRVLGSIHERAYDHKRLHGEIQMANNEIKTLLSIHRYDSKGGQRAA